MPMLFYPPLRSSTSIRLLRLFTAEQDEMIKCDLYQCDLEERPDYTALSYEWSSGTAPVIVNEQTCWIQENLHAFLKAVRSRSPISTTIWVDFLCINQDDLAERNLQVQMMRRIYLYAEKVISWLGPADGATSMAMAFCNDTGRTSLVGSVKFDGEGVFRDWVTRFQSAKGEERREAIVSEMFGHFHALSMRRYWSRTWIVPEVLLAKRLILQSGDHSTEWTSLVAALQFLLSRCDCDAYSLSVWPMIDIRDAILAQQPVSLHVLIERFGAKRCLRDVDRIYALMGVHTYQKAILPLVVDYSAPIHRVFIDTLYYGLNGGRDLAYDGIEYCQRLQEILALSPRGCLIHSVPLRKDLTIAPCLWLPEFRQRRYRQTLTRIGCVGARQYHRSIEPDLVAFEITGQTAILLTESRVSQGDVLYQMPRSDGVLVARETHEHPGQSYTQGFGALAPSYQHGQQVPIEFFRHEFERATIDLEGMPAVWLSLLDIIVFGSVPCSQNL